MRVSNADKSAFPAWAACCALAAASLAGPAHAADEGKRFGFGTPATEEQIAGWNIDIGPDGENLPPGSGTVAQGKQIYESACMACHGAKGEGGMGDRLVGGMGTLTSDKPVKTIGSFWPYATTLFDYIRRAMPLMAPQSLSNDEVYAVTGYLLHLNGIVKEDATLDAQALREIRMPNRDGFVDDARPDVKHPACMKDCPGAL
jgi:Cytochrome c